MDYDIDWIEMLWGDFGKQWSKYRGFLSSLEASSMWTVLQRRNHVVQLFLFPFLEQSMSEHPRIAAMLVLGRWSTRYTVPRDTLERDCADTCMRAHRVCRRFCGWCPANEAFLAWAQKHELVKADGGRSVRQLWVPIEVCLVGVSEDNKH